MFIPKRFVRYFPFNSSSRFFNSFTSQLRNSSREIGSFSTIRSHEIVITVERAVWWKFRLNWVMHLSGNLHGIHHFVNLTLISESLAPRRPVETFSILRGEIWKLTRSNLLPMNIILELFRSNAIEQRFVGVFWKQLAWQLEHFTWPRANRSELSDVIVTENSSVKNIFTLRMKSRNLFLIDLIYQASFKMH